MQKTDKIKDIMQRYENKLGIDKNKVYLIYNGSKVNDELSFEELVNKEDNNMINIIIYEINNSTKIEDKKDKSKEIIYSKERENYIIGEIEIKKKVINKVIRIINSYEEVKRYNKYTKVNKKYENEKEIKDNCIIQINNEAIPFSYFYKFKEKGKYKI